ncbi:baculoviral IAP repeat-containing protein 7 isoform X2 [Hirundo rustica]|uniref:baculoviral IAP repeat-containing protein 7 isoform X2 n=1 Tax=Hirundo rustica TaxID=43150 RepID=UPI001A941D2C|nr:baculoviral IAP repeat-containing protein 7 isoform X2 [Hirundo rustica]
MEAFWDFVSMFQSTAMGDAAPAERPEPRASRCRLFDSSMRSVARRMRTFQQWPRTAPVSARDLAEAGFYYVGPRDEVQCFCCGGVLKDWRPGDRPVAEHLNYFPSCKYLRGKDVRKQEMVSSLQGIFDAVDGQFLSVLQGIVSEDAALPNEPEYPEMVREEMRLSTFENWPPNSNVYPEQLARAGFFYTGQGDVVRCFYCDGGVRSWSVGDDPWREHAKWYPECEFLLHSRGREFVSSVQATFSTTLLAPRRSWDWTEQGSSPSQGAAQRGAGTSRQEMRSVQQKESDESQLSTEEQLRRLQEERTCKVCMDKDVSVVFVPCGHLVACEGCALNLRLCPICRAVIRGSVRAFMS